MAAKLETHGDIEVICDTSHLAPNKRAQLVFRTWGEACPPYRIRVRAPRGSVIVDRVLRVLPTGEPQSAPPVSFSVQRGEYTISIEQLDGKNTGHATLCVD